MSSAEEAYTFSAENGTRVTQSSNNIHHTNNCRLHVANTSIRNREFRLHYCLYNILLAHPYDDVYPVIQRYLSTHRVLLTASSEVDRKSRFIAYTDIYMGLPASSVFIHEISNLSKLAFRDESGTASRLKRGDERRGSRAIIVRGDRQGQSKICKRN